MQVSIINFLLNEMKILKCFGSRLMNLIHFCILITSTTDPLIEHKLCCEKEATVCPLSASILPLDLFLLLDECVL